MNKRQYCTWFRFARLGHVLRGLACLATFTGLSITATAADYNGPDISFAQIYASPDDQNLNLNYARQQAALGDYISAASALERLLFAQPNADSARLFYAMVLFKLDDRAAALHELTLLESRPLTADQRTQVSAYKNKVSGTGKRQSASGFSGRVAVGVRYDDNASNALADNGLVLTTQGDTSIFAQGTLRYSTPISTSNTRLNAAIHGQSLRHESISAADYDTLDGSIGISGRADDWTWSVDGQVMQVSISGSKYLTQVGPKFKLGKSVSDQAKIWASVAYFDQNYHDLAFTSTETLRSGSKYVGKAGLDFKINATTRLDVSAGLEDKNAQNADFAYTGLRASANYRTEFSNGAEFGVYGRYRKLNYDTIAAPSREDKHVYLRASIGAPLANIGQWVGAEASEPWKNVKLEAAINYNDRASSISAFKYKNTGAELRLSWGF